MAAHHDDAIASTTGGDGDGSLGKEVGVTDRVRDEDKKDGASSRSGSDVDADVEEAGEEVDLVTINRIYR